MKAWHFLPKGRHLRFGSREFVKVGKPVHVKGQLEMCIRGLHASIPILDALAYSPGPVVCRVKCEGEIIHDTHKLVCSKRTVLWMYDATEVLYKFARMCALDVVHLWDAPPIVIEYLKTGDASLHHKVRVAVPSYFTPAYGLASHKVKTHAASAAAKTIHEYSHRAAASTYFHAMQALEMCSELSPLRMHEKCESQARRFYRLILDGYSGDKHGNA